MKFTALIPRAFNDGTPVPPELLERLIKDLSEPFGGMTREDGIQGCWVDVDGTEYRDETIRISIVCDRERLQEALKAVRRIGRKLKQKAIYFEVFGYDGVQFLRIEKGTT